MWDNRGMVKDLPPEATHAVRRSDILAGSLFLLGVGLAMLLGPEWGWPFVVAGTGGLIIYVAMWRDKNPKWLNGSLVGVMGLFVLTSALILAWRLLGPMPKASAHLNPAPVPPTTAQLSEDFAAFEVQYRKNHPAPVVKRGPTVNNAPHGIANSGTINGGATVNNGTPQFLREQPARFHGGYLMEKPQSSNTAPQGVANSGNINGNVTVNNGPTRPVTLQDIANYASGRVVAIGHGSADFPLLPGGIKYTGTGFWVHERGYAAACSDAVYDGGLESLKVDLGAGDPSVITIPGTQGGTVRFSDMTMPLPALADNQNGTGIVLLLVPAIAQGIRATIGPGHTPVPPKDFSFVLATELPQRGERIFLYGAEPERSPSFSIYEGKIIRLGSFVAYSDIPFQDTYCGAPVITENRSIVGMAIGKTSKGETEIIDAINIADLMKSAGLK